MNKTGLVEIRGWVLLVLETLVFGTIISGRSIELVRYVVLCAQMVYFMRLSTSGLASLRSLALVEPWGQVECEKLKTSELPLRNFEHAVPGQKPRKCATLFSQATKIFAGNRLFACCRLLACNLIFAFDRSVVLVQVHARLRGHI